MKFYNLDEWELYDLEKDPREMTNVYSSPEYESITKQLKTELETLRAQYQVPEKDPNQSKQPKRKKN